MLRKMTYSTWQDPRKPYTTKAIRCIYNLPPSATRLSNHCREDVLNTENYITLVAAKEAIIYLVRKKYGLSYQEADAECVATEFSKRKVIRNFKSN
ncbi:uncharacterized protein [Antedon mediterranea]|uniref:uncharacterized protein isoform X2 n=1 Tax=Antedon mediterranea TaxID=105859 RepID=UPI003AF62A6F